MDLLAGIDGARRRDHRLRDHLAAENAVARGRRERRKGEFVGFTRRLKIEQARYGGNHRSGIDAGVDGTGAFHAGGDLIGGKLVRHDHPCPSAVRPELVEGPFFLLRSKEIRTVLRQAQHERNIAGSD